MKWLLSEIPACVKLLFFSFAVFISIVNVNGNPLVYEHFESYDLGELNGANGGSGWNGSWITSSTNLEEIVNPTIPLHVSTAVTFKGSNKVVKINGESPDGESSLNNNAIRREISIPYTNDVVYVSYLFRAVEGLDDGDFIVLWLDDHDEDDESEHSAGSAFIGVTGDEDGIGTAFIRLCKTVYLKDQVDDPAGISEGLDYLFVAKLFKDTGSSDYNKMTFWVNPTLEDVQLGSNTIGTASYNNIGLSSVTHIGIRTGRSTERTDEFLFDRICLATNAIDVMPGPIAGDSFDLPLGEISGKTGGYGFGDNPWIIESGSTNYSEIIEPTVPLQYTNASGSIDGGNRALETTGIGEGALYFYALRALDQAIPDKVFFSFLARYNGKDSDDFYALWFDDNGVTDNHHTTDVPNIGLRNGDLYIRLGLDNTATLLSNVNDGQTVCFLGLLERTDGSTTYNSFKAWVDPDVYIDYSTPDAAVLVNPDTGLGYVKFIGTRMGSYTEFTDKLLLDRLTLGTTLNSVMPLSMEAPEPLKGTVILIQ